MKKLFAVLLALTLVLSMGITAFAADTGTITINSAVIGENYSVYKMLNFEPADSEGKTGVYTIEDGWLNFFNEEPATNYFTVVDNAGKITVTLKDGVTAVDPEVAKAAIAYAETNTISATKTVPSTSETVEIAGLEFGYYAINTSLGTVCALTNTNSDFELTEKSQNPGIEKFVQEDFDDSWGKVNDATVGDIVYFKANITVGQGITANYIMHDSMTDGLDFAEDSVVVDAGDVDATGKYTVKTENLEDDCDFEIEFDDDFIEALEGKTFTVTYSATLTDKAFIANEETGNLNEVELTYGESNTSAGTDNTRTFTWKMDVLKYTDGENGAKNPLAGATFQLRTDADNENSALKFSAVDGATVPTYVVDADGTVDITTDENGKFEIVGLDEGMYYLVETEAPEGYNKLTEALDVEITSEHFDQERNATYKINDKDPATIDVLNKTGGLLPETGGIGTTIFYAVGGLLMVAAVIFLVSKKRMAAFA